jgi:hypothetical protein
MQWLTHSSSRHQRLNWEPFVRHGADRNHAPSTLQESGQETYHNVVGVISSAERT